MSLLGWVILFTLLGSLLSVLAAALFLWLPEHIRARALPHLVSFAIGVLLGAAFLDLLPEALEIKGTGITASQIMLTILLGVLGFFLLEKMLLWRHSEARAPQAVTRDSQKPTQAAGTLVLVGGAIHNLFDGVLIAAAFLTSIELGIITGLAVAAHKVPHEVGDFAILLHSGYEIQKAFFFNILSSLTGVLGGLLAYYSLEDMTGLLPFILAVAAASFIYIAMVDLIPALHKRVQGRATLQQIVLIGLGIVLIYSAHPPFHVH